MFSPSRHSLPSLIPAQLHDLMQLKQENSYLTTIARQISPYILSIAKVKERLEPRCGDQSLGNADNRLCHAFQTNV